MESSNVRRKRKTKENTDVAVEHTRPKRGRNIKSKAADESNTVTSKYFDAASSQKPSLKRTKKAEGKKTASVDKTTKVSTCDGESTSNPTGTGEAVLADTKIGTAIPATRLDFKFYDLPCADLSKALLGQTVVTTYEGKRLSGKIVETEAYLGLIDKAAHSYKGKTNRNAAMFMKPGTAYVYNIYGMYCCMNISAQVDGCAVLIRALQPIDNLDLMDKLRTKGKEGSSFLKKEGKGLCNGPSKLCQALAIKKDTVDQVDLCTSDGIWLEKGELVDDCDVVSCKRININYAEDWVDKPLRFYIRGSNFNSVRDKNAENDKSG